MSTSVKPLIRLFIFGNVRENASFLAFAFVGINNHIKCYRLFRLPMLCVFLYPNFPLAFLFIKGDNLTFLFINFRSLAAHN